MNTKSPLLLPLAASLLVLQACGTVDQRNCDTQPAARVDTVIMASQGEAPPAAMPATPAAPVAVAIPVAGPASIAMAPPEAAPAAADAGAALLDRYTVVPGDTLAGIAARKDVYGDARLWPLLYRANVQLIGPRGVIFPNQVLVVGRNHSADEVNALIAQPKRTVPPPTVAKPAVTPPVVAATPVEVSASPSAKPIEVKVAEASPGEAKSVEVRVAENKPAAAPAGSAPKGAPAADAQFIKPIEYLNSARRAFSAGDAPWATYYYSMYLEQKNDDANAWGELGNVYYFDGDLADAAKAYYNAANLLIDRGLTARALDLVPAIEEGDPGLAEALHQRLTTIKR